MLQPGPRRVSWAVTPLSPHIREDGQTPTFREGKGNWRHGHSRWVSVDGAFKRPDARARRRPGKMPSKLPCRLRVVICAKSLVRDADSLVDRGVCGAAGAVAAL